MAKFLTIKVAQGKFAYEDIPEKHKQEVKEILNRDYLLEI